MLIRCERVPFFPAVMVIDDFVTQRRFHKTPLAASCYDVDLLITDSFHIHKWMKHQYRSNDVFATLLNSDQHI